MQLEFVVRFFGALGFGAGIVDNRRAAEWFTKAADLNGMLNRLGRGFLFVQDAAYVNRGHRQFAGAYEVQRAGADLGREKFSIQLDVAESGCLRQGNDFAEHVSEFFMLLRRVLLENVGFHRQTRRTMVRGAKGGRCTCE